MSFADHFSTQATDYSRYRPTYPPELFAWLAGLVEAHDASRRQLRQARSHPGVSYLVAAAERAPFGGGRLDLVTVAQALHWFDFDAFFAETRRVVRPGGVLAAWTYDLVTVDADVDAVVRWFYSEVVGPYWPPERRYVEEQYRTLPFPFEAVGPVPDFGMGKSWSREDLVAQAGTWSSTNRYRRDRGEDPLELLRPRLAEVWPDPEEHRPVHWTVHLRAGRV